MKDYILNIRAELETYITKYKLQSLVLGVSGGADSALVALLARPVCDKLGIKLLAYSIPIISNKQEEIVRAANVGNHFATHFAEVDLSDEFRAVSGKIEKKEQTLLLDLGDKKTEDLKRKIRMGNIKARLRMIYLYDKAQQHQGVVLSTDNYTEFLLGFWTLHGDVGDYGMIQELWKTEVYDMLQAIKTYELTNPAEQQIVQSIIDANATDGLGITNTDLDQLLPGWKGSSRDGYAEVDRMLKDAIHDVYELKRFGSDNENLVYTSNPVLERMLTTQYKRENPYNIPRKEIVKKEREKKN